VRRRAVALGLICGIGGFLWLPAHGTGPGAAEPGEPERAFLSRVRQLTFEGRRAGEGYFSSDGNRMVFQSEREPGNPFFQIFVLDLQDGSTRRVSTGTGKTTCPYFQPGTGGILFASTHHDPRSEELSRQEFELRAGGKERRYAWDFDPQMELYVGEADGGPLRRLTEVEGYDAEGSYAPDGRRIVFTSTRHAYATGLAEEDRKRRDVDPSYFAEIYLMGEDGSGVRRLTRAAGYDGGPFFTADGSEIVWRRFDPEGLIADVHAMKPDGTGERKLTDFGSMSWAPYPHPSGRYVIFTSNKLGFGNFELYIVDMAGRKEPVRVTHTEGFDGLPVFTPDGRQLSWTSTRRGGEGGQIFLAGWSHDQALAALGRAEPRRPASQEEPR
jgi:Tol biopolymer transport system component